MPAQATSYKVNIVAASQLCQGLFLISISDWTDKDTPAERKGKEGAGGAFQHQGFP